MVQLDLKGDTPTPHTAAAATKQVRENLYEALKFT